MTTTYTSEHNPWRVESTLQKRLQVEADARQLAGNSVDMLGIVSVYAGRDWEGSTASGRKSLFPGRALVTKRSDPARHVRAPLVPPTHSSRRRFAEQQQQQQFVDENELHYYNNNNNQNKTNETGNDDDDRYYYHHYDQQQKQQQSQGFNEQFNQQYYRNGQHQFQSSFQQQTQQQPQQGFEYSNMSELDFLSNQQPQQQSQHESSQYYFEHQNNDNDNNNNNHLSGRNSPSHDEAIEQQQIIREEQRRQRVAEMSDEQIRDMEINRQIAEQHGLYTKNSYRDIRLSRECRYGIVGGGRREGRGGGGSKNLTSRGNESHQQLHEQQQERLEDDNEGGHHTLMTEQEQQDFDRLSPSAKRRKEREIARRRQHALQHIQAPSPLNPRDYPVQPTSFSHIHDKPLVYCEGSGDFVRVGDAYSSFPVKSEKYSQIHQRMVDRKKGTSAALHKAIEEIKFNDRALLVNLPLTMTNHKSNQVYFLGGGNAAVSKYDFLEKNTV